MSSLPRTENGPKLIDCGKSFIVKSPHEEIEADLEFYNKKYRSIEKSPHGCQIKSFENRIATLFGKESACFVVSAKLAQLIILKIHSQNHADIRSFAIHEHAYLSQSRIFEDFMRLKAVLVGDRDQVLTFEQIQRDLDMTATHCAKVISSLVINLPMSIDGGLLPSWDDLSAMHNWAKRRNVTLHADGAKIWETKVFYKRSFNEIGNIFDTLYVSFHDSMPSSGGGMILGNEKTISQFRLLLNEAQGFIPTPFSSAINAERNFDDLCARFDTYSQKLIDIVSQLKKDFPNDEKIIFRPSLPQTSTVRVILKGQKNVLIAARDQIVKVNGVSLFEKIHEICLSAKLPDDSPNECFFDWTMGPENAGISMTIYLKAWKKFFEHRDHISLQHNTHA